MIDTPNALEDDEHADLRTFFREATISATVAALRGRTAWPLPPVPPSLSDQLVVQLTDIARLMADELMEMAPPSHREEVAKYVPAVFRGQLVLKTD